MKYKVNPPYFPLVQMRYCCMPCCVQWILNRRKMKLISQEEIGIVCNLRIPVELSNLFSKKVKKTKNPENYGTDLFMKRDYKKLNKFFDKKKINLKSMIYLSSEIKDHKKFIKDNLIKGNDILTFFHWWGFSKKKQKVGHGVVISEMIDGRDPILIVGDPSSARPKFWKIKLSKLLKCQKINYDGRERGFVIFSKK